MLEVEQLEVVEVILEVAVSHVELDVVLGVGRLLEDDF